LLDSSVVKLRSTDIREVGEQPWVSGSLVRDATQLDGGYPWIAIFDMGKDVGDGAAIDRERESLARFKLRDDGCGGVAEFANRNVPGHVHDRSTVCYKHPQQRRDGE
jgi:hypothetical protein